MKDATFSSARLLRLYDRISDADDAIPRLRRFVLDLAVRGKLVEQDAADEPAAELLKRITIERNGRVKSGQIRKGKTTEPIEAAPLETPHGWVWLPLGDTGNIFTGNSIDAATREKLEKTKAGRPFIATKDVGYGLDPIDYDNGLLVPTSDESFKVARALSVLICAEGGSAGRKIGITDRDICFGNKLLANETWSVVSPRFVMFVYLSSFFYEQFAEQMTGIIGGISINRFLQLPFPLPPLAEQHRIVAKVDELMALCDRLQQARAGCLALRDRLTTASLTRLTAAETTPETFQSHARFALQALPTLTTRPAQIKTLRQTILNLAVRGRLVKQDAGDEPTSELLKRIKAKNVGLQKMKGIRASKSAEAASGFDTLAEVPCTWLRTHLQEIAYQITDGTHLTPRYTAIGKPFLSAQNVKPFRFMPDQYRFVSVEDFEGYRANRKPERGDVLLTRVGAGIGEAAVLDSDFEFAFYVSLCLIKVPTDLFCPEYLVLWLNSPEGRACSTSRTYGKGASQGNLNLSMIRTFEIPLPPLAEQHRIVAKVDALMALCDQLEANLTTTATTRSRLLEALLHEALTGNAEGKVA